MSGEGLGAQVWLTMLGVLLMFFVLPFTMLEMDRRKTARQQVKAAPPPPPPPPPAEPSPPMRDRHPSV
jgi:hypothetical protein